MENVMNEEQNQQQQQGIENHVGGARIVRWYNTERLHSSLGYLRPLDYYRGDPKSLHEARRRKLTAARHHRRERNLKLRQPTLPLES
jgi:putative transposase